MFTRFKRLSIKIKTLGVIAAVFIAFSLLTNYMAASEFEEQALRRMKFQAQGVADTVLTTLNSMMLRDTIGDRKHFLDLVRRTINGLDQVHVFRSPRVIAQYGLGLEGERAVDELEQTALSTGEPVYRIIDEGSGRKLRAILPYLMSIDRGGINCLQCHDGKAGDVNGAISMTLSLDDIDQGLTNNRIKLAVYNLIGLIAILIIVLTIQYRFVLNPIARLRDAIENIERNSDLSRSIDVDSEDEVGVTASAFNKMLSKFKSIIGHMATSADQLAAATTELSYSTEQSASQADIQSRKVAEMSSAISEVNQAISSIARNSVDVAKTSEVTRINAMKGGKVISGSAETIEKLSDYSSKIGSILMVIEDIAKKTDLLAINAAIEAANAGEQGKGFAVVADEVRKLAERTTRATGEIGHMIQDIQGLTSSAVDSMRDSSKAMSSIIVDATRVNEMVDNIAASTEKQAAIIRQMLGTVRTVQEYSEGFVLSADQSKDVASELNSQSVRLQDMVDQFKVEEDDTVPG